jgi:peptide/nickel transport system substrate-binding protein
MKKINKLISLVAISALAGTMLTGCGGNSSNESTATNGTVTESTEPVDAGIAESLVYAQGADPRGLDPALVDDGESSKVMCQIYEGLLKYSKDSTEIEPCLAKEWEISEDNLVYTFHLQEGVTFHDGTPFNAEAVKFNIDRQTVNVTEDMAYAGFVYQYVDSCEVVDEYTVKIKLTAVCTPFLNNLAMSMAAPMVSPAACEQSSNNLNEAPCGTGPYKFVRWDKQEAVVLERNEEYWGEKPKSKNIIFKTIADNSARVVALTNGEVDVIDGIDANVVDQITNGGCELNLTEGMNINYMAFNMDSPVCSDAEVRKALSQAVDVEELVKGLYRGYATKADTILPTFIPGYSDSITRARYDEAAAKEVLAAKGITEIHMITYSNVRPYNTASGQTLAESIQGYFSKVGITATIDSFDWTTYKEKVTAGDYDICFYGWMGDNGDADNFMNLLADSDPSMNVSRYNNEEYKALIAQALQAANGDERNAIYAQLEQIAADDYVWLPISHSQVISAYNPLVKDFYYHVTGNVFLSQVYKQQ